MATQRPRAGSRTPATTYRAIVDLTLRPGPSLTPAQVYAELKRRGLDSGASPRTVQRILAELGGGDESGPWSMADGAPEDAPLVLSVARALIEDSGDPWAKWPRWPTRAVAEWIVRVLRAYPDLADPVRTYYLAALATRGQVERVQTFLAFTPWRDGGAALFDAVARGTVTADALMGNDVYLDYLEWKAERDLEARKERHHAK